jgi:predicted deacetylase
VSLLVSIHDVTPALGAAVARLWSICAERDLLPALLVVPNWHGQCQLHLHPAFVGWLRERASQGAEIVLHGERHDEVGLPRRPADHWRAWGRTAREGEFLTLSEPQAYERIVRARRYLQDLGLEPVGFVPPAWLAREEGYRAVARAGLGFSEDDRWVRLFPAGQRIPAPVVRWSARSPARAWGSVAVAGGRWLLQRRSPVARVALHPQDLGHAATARAVPRTLDRWLSLHQPISYSELRRATGPATQASS